MFQRLAAEESDHVRRLQAERQSLLEKHEWLKREPARLPLSRKIVEEIFPQKELLKIEVKDQTSDLEALNIAMNLERRSHEFFIEFAKDISDARGRKIFMDFAKDEESHLQALVTEYNSLIRS
jgi:rubrerythrin